MRQKLFNYFFDKAPIAGFLWLCVFLFGLMILIRTTLQYDLIVNHKLYLKKEIVIDSLNYSNTDGQGSSAYWTGFSKELNNYKTEIAFGNLGKQTEQELLKKVENKEKFDIWYNLKSNEVHLAKKEDKAYPMEEFWIWKFYEFAIILLTYLNFRYWRSKPN